MFRRLNQKVLFSRASADESFAMPAFLNNRVAISSTAKATSNSILATSNDTSPLQFRQLPTSIDTPADAMGKKRRGHPDVEDILSRPWCYYCMAASLSPSALRSWKLTLLQASVTLRI